jgi:hypothetical protein
MKVNAHVAVTVALTVRGDNWNDDTSVEQLHREAGELPLKRINDLCQRYVTIIGKPKIEAVLTNNQDRSSAAQYRPSRASSPARATARARAGS